MKKNYSININITTLIIIGVVIFFAVFGGIGYHIKTNNDYKKQIAEEIKLKNALIDTMEIYRNEANELVAEKLTLQADLSELKEINENLTQSQRNLLNRINQLSDEKRVIAAALIEANVIIDSLLHSGITIIDPENAKITFLDKQEHFEYDIEVTNVVQADTTSKSELYINNLSLPNDMFIEFHWELNKRENYPIAFSVTNTNPYYQIHNIESYAIPELQKEDLDPNAWNKISKWVKNNGGLIIKLGGAGLGGYLIGRSVSK